MAAQNVGNEVDKCSKKTRPHESEKKKWIEQILLLIHQSACSHTIYTFRSVFYFYHFILNATTKHPCVLWNFRHWSRCSARRHTQKKLFFRVHTSFFTRLVHSNNGITVRSKNLEIKHLQNGIGTVYASDTVAQRSHHNLIVFGSPLHCAGANVCMGRKSATDTMAEKRMRARHKKIK